MNRSTLFIFLGLFALTSLSAAPPTSEKLEKVEAALQSLLDSGSIVGAQLAIGYEGKVLLNRNFGIRSASDDTPVDSETMFCIGSCSKPIASAVVMALVDEERLVLDQEIDRWLPKFGSLKTDAGKSARTPTVIELLSHHGGIYSQKKGMTKRQSRWIRDFKLTLEDAVNGIAREPLFADPGAEYAYSGAGYCVVGRVAEEASGKSFEALLQEHICGPLALKHTSYFPIRSNRNIASGSLNGKVNQATPHLSKPFKLPLIGGSLYSTAGDSAKFLSRILAASNDKSEELMSSDSFKTYTTRYSEKAPYALGWSVMMGNGKPFGITHSGSLASSRALFQVNLKSGVYVTVLYTVSDPRSAQETGRSIAQAMRPLIALRP